MNPDVRRLTVSMTVEGTGVEMSMDVPIAPVRPEDLLPIFRSVAGMLVELGVRAVEEKGEAVSCRKGCGACCRQVVPMAPAEARVLAQLVAGLSEPRRGAVLARFQEACRRLVEEGLHAPLRRNENLSREERRALGLAYFRLGIPCPFLEEESCSIHAERPISCREYLVTSPADECSRPTPELVRMVPLAGQVWSTLSAATAPPRAGSIPWVPLVLAMEFAREEGDPGAARPPEELMESFFRSLSSSISARPRLG